MKLNQKNLVIINLALIAVMFIVVIFFYYKDKELMDKATANQMDASSTLRKAVEENQKAVFALERTRERRMVYQELARPTKLRLSFWGPLHMGFIGESTVTQQSNGLWEIKIPEHTLRVTIHPLP